MKKIMFNDKYGLTQPVGEELEVAADEYELTHPDDETPIGIAFIAGANWQKEQDEKDLADMLTVEYLRGAEWGKQDTKEQMMKEAIPFYEILKVVPPGPERDKVRIIIVKEG